jgi:hypothetical protein
MWYVGWQDSAVRPLCTGYATSTTPEVSKEITGVDQIDTTPIFDVYAGDIFTYTITIDNPYKQPVYFAMTDPLDSYVEYVGDLFTSNLVTYTMTTPLGAGESFELAFDVQVKDSAPQGWFIENVATIKAFFDPLNISGTTLTIVEAIAPQGKVVPIPEPKVVIFIGIGLLGIFAIARRTLKKGR